ncbi:hypothetical protein ACP3V3_02905 [Vibrio sp. PNB22_3_1]
MMAGNTFYKASQSKKKKPFTRTFTMPDGTELIGRHVIVPSAQIEEMVVVHPLNPRYQKAITAESLGDILPLIIQGGVQFEGIAVEMDGKFAVLDASRRRMAAIIAKKDLPLWVFESDAPLSRKNSEYISEVARASKALSYREEGMLLIKAMHEDPKLNNLEALMDAFRYDAKQERTVRRYIDAAIIPQELIDMFPDSENIPNDFYSKLKAICKEVARRENVKPEKDEATAAFFERLRPIMQAWAAKHQDSIMNVDPQLKKDARQSIVLENMKTCIYGKNEAQPDPTWSQPERIYELNKSTYVSLKRHKNGREIKLHAKRLTQKKEQQLLDFIENL